LRSIFQTYDQTDIYPSIEEKAANLLYLIIKNHPFIDGNKRIGSFMFIRFLNLNGLLYRKNGSKIVEESTLVAIALMIAQSESEFKDTMINLVINLFAKKNKGRKFM
jgi:death-on-curing family protein